MYKTILSSIFIIVGLGLMMNILSGCGPKSYHYKSSAVHYLYPNKEEIQKPGVPALALPLKVGIAFVPDVATLYKKVPLTESGKVKLMKKVSEHFKKYEFVGSIEIIPSNYLQPHGSFTNLDQLSTMYGVDVIALVSYDQHQFTDEGIASLSYWTIIGAYIVPGEKNDTHTMVDVVVYDIKSQKLLFRAPGVSHIKGLATPINLSEELRNDSIKGFEVASEDLITNLDIQLQLFKEKVKESPEEYKIKYRPGYIGGGSIDSIFLFLIGSVGAYFFWSRRRQDI